MARRKARTIVHVNRHAVRANQTRGQNKPVLTVRCRNETGHGHEAAVLADDGTEVGRFVYRPDRPLSCGARVWFETRLRVVPLDRGEGGSRQPLGSTVVATPSRVTR